MSYDLDEDILQDFLIEAGEILELLSEQLVELENNPEDKDLLNAIFRGFHTVKGGAGFLSLAELVDTCHGAENVFDVLRNGQRSVTPSLMDTMLKALDTVNLQFQAVQEQKALEAAAPELLNELHRLCKPESEDEGVMLAEVATIISEPVIPETLAGSDASEVSSSVSALDDITQDEFEKLLDELHGRGSGPSVQPVAPTSYKHVDASVDIDNGDITDDEFESLLDELHGIGKSPSNGNNPTAICVDGQKSHTALESDANGSDFMTDDEFEKLLDELHGTGQGPSVEELDFATKPVSANAVPQIESRLESSQPASKVPPAPNNKPKPVTTKEEVKTAASPTKKTQAEATVRVDTSTLDTIMNMVGELVLVRNRLLSLGLSSNNEEMSKAVANLDVVTADLQGAVMKTRMQPIKKVFGRFPRVVRDLARNLNKDIVLEMRGEETDLDKNLVEALADPLIHLVRNSVDHGIEMPDDRARAGKSQTGKVTLSASQEGDHINLAIVDDGGGMDPEKLRSIAVKRGMMDEDAAARLSDKECFNLIFAPGFSSKDKISDISGRGVGMDVVKTAINTLNGSIDIDSKLGEGTKITIKVPLTLAILPTLMVGVGGNPFALPLASVNEIFHLDLSRTNVVDGQLTIIVRDKSIPLFYLQNWLTSKSPRLEKQQGHGHVVIVQIGSQRVGFVVDTLIGQEEVVIKPLDNLLQGTPGMAGATITSDGHIALILDVPDLLKQYAAASRI
ncbi:chemotaxis protein CheA [Vibrio sagamiensis]|uniref:Chemotaxis protein CheA n=1 Tax=Vibrio sagamiensis NBRC 104589 TaxID=1219064 RepID=A0A511QAL5_9VIBR|nr:chemotaxis protein CheA [Vibrio sagamiensis]PNQ71447.1 chemotaxis protein CheA [Vibrio agarivorans]GEM74351.1 chemotaxis protein CheA [Vibrio sagamiensis NBRC 104589]